MPTKKFVRFILLTLLVSMAACSNDDGGISATILGRWSGQEADFKVNPSGIIPAFPQHKDEFPVQLEFKSNSVVTLTDNKGTRNGTYVQNGNQLTIDIDYMFEMIGLSGTYEINELTSSDLEVEIEKQGSYSHPETGQQFDGKVKAILFFKRANN